MALPMRKRWIPATPKRAAAARVASPAGSSTDGRRETWTRARKRGTSCKATCQSWQLTELSPRILLGLWAVATALTSSGVAVIVHAQSQPVPLECRLHNGPWQPCQMKVITVGEQWTIVVGPRRFAFRHNGTGTVQVETGGRRFEVSPTWAADQSLCWGTLCMRGAIPLD